MKISMQQKNAAKKKYSQWVCWFGFHWLGWGESAAVPVQSTCFLESRKQKICLLTFSYVFDEKCHFLHFSLAMFAIIFKKKVLLPCPFFSGINLCYFIFHSQVFICLENALLDFVARHQNLEKTKTNFCQINFSVDAFPSSKGAMHVLFYVYCHLRKWRRHPTGWDYDHIRAYSTTRSTYDRPF